MSPFDLSGKDVLITGSTSGINSVVADTTPQLGGNLDLNTKTISGSGTISMVGNISGQQITGSNVLFTNVNATGVTSTTLAATSGITGATLNTTGLISGSIIKSLMQYQEVVYLYKVQLRLLEM